MASYYSLLSFMAVTDFEYSDPRSFDLIRCLPLEMAITIMRLLSGKDLLNAACVSKKWFDICKSDAKLRQKIRRHLRHQRRATIAERFLGTRSVNGPRNLTNRPAMVNVANTKIPAASRDTVSTNGSISTRYMPYRREVVTTRGNSSRRRNRPNVVENNHARSMLRM